MVKNYGQLLLVFCCIAAFMQFIVFQITQKHENFEFQENILKPTHPPYTELIIENTVNESIYQKLIWSTGREYSINLNYSGGVPRIFKEIDWSGLYSAETEERCASPMWKDSRELKQYEVAFSKGVVGYHASGADQECIITLRVISFRGPFALNLTLQSLVNAIYPEKNAVPLLIVVAAMPGERDQQDTIKVAKKYATDWKHGPSTVLVAPRSASHPGLEWLHSWHPEGDRDNVFFLEDNLTLNQFFFNYLLQLLKVYKPSPGHAEHEQIVGISILPDFNLDPTTVKTKKKNPKYPFGTVNVYFGAWPSPFGVLYFGAEYMDFLLYAQARIESKDEVQGVEFPTTTPLWLRLMTDFMKGRGLVVVYPLLWDPKKPTREDGLLTLGNVHMFGGGNKTIYPLLYELISVKERLEERLLYVKITRDALDVVLLNSSHEASTFKQMAQAGVNLIAATPNSDVSMNLLWEIPLPGCALPPLADELEKEIEICNVSERKMRTQRDQKNSPIGERRYLTYQPFGGLTNQLLSLHSAIQIAVLLDRILVVPHLISGNGLGSSYAYSDAYDFEGLRASLAKGTVVEMQEFLNLKIMPKRVVFLKIAAKHLEQNLNYYESVGWTDLPLYNSPSDIFTPSNWHRMYGTCSEQVLAFSSLFMAFSHAERRRNWRANAEEKKWNSWLHSQVFQPHPTITQLALKALNTLQEKSQGKQPVVCAHIRRGDFLNACKAYIDEAAEDRYARRALKRLVIRSDNLCYVNASDVVENFESFAVSKQSPVFIATDDIEFIQADELNDYLLFTIHDLLDRRSYPEKWQATLDQLICSLSDVVILNMFSTFSDAIKKKVLPKTNVLYWQSHKHKKH